jgi:NAD-dependent DNA ligase
VRRQIEFVDLSDQPPGAHLDIVGESRFQENLRHFGGPGTVDGVTKESARALVMPEPDNEHDENAIVVYLSDEQNRALKAGYLSRDDAIAYRPVFRAIAPRAIVTDARLKGGWDRGAGDQGFIGVALKLGSPREVLLQVLDMADVLGKPPLVPTANPWAGKLIVFTGDSGFRLFGERLSRDVQEVLAIRAGSRTHPRVTKSVDLLVIGDIDRATAKLDKAEEYGLEMVAEAEYWRALGYALEPLWGGARLGVG